MRSTRFVAVALACCGTTGAFAPAAFGRAATSARFDVLRAASAPSTVPAHERDANDDAFWAALPPLANSGEYPSGRDRGLAWRQDAQLVQLWAPLPDGVSAKRGVVARITRRALALVVGGEPLVGDADADAPLGGEVVAADSLWFVESELADDGAAAFLGFERFVVVELRKAVEFATWDALLAANAGGGAGGADADAAAAARSSAAAAPPPPNLSIGGGARQKEATARQLAAYQVARYI